MTAVAALIMERTVRPSVGDGGLMMRSVVLHEVSKFYDSVPVVNGVSLRVADGEFVTLLGPSGCGKTTTLRMIAGLAAPDRGRIEVGGSDVTHTPIHHRNVGMVFQSHALFPHMTIAENVGFGLKMRGVGHAERTGRIREALKLVRLDNFESRFPGQLSGGQQQRIALARALVFNPQVLLLDEPFGALDRKLREVMQGELRELTRKLEMTSIFVTHDQEEALILSDRIAVMHAGEIEQIGSPEDIFERPRTRFVADFMGFGNLLEGVVMSAADDGATVKVGAWESHFPQASGLSPGQRVGLAIRAERIRIKPFTSTESVDLAGEIDAASYQGAAQVYLVRLDRIPGLNSKSATESKAAVISGCPSVLASRSTGIPAPSKFCTFD